MKTETERNGRERDGRRCAGCQQNANRKAGTKHTSDNVYADATSVANGKIQIIQDVYKLCTETAAQSLKVVHLW